MSPSRVTTVAAMKKIWVERSHLSFHAEWPGNIWLTANLQWCEVGPAGRERWRGSAQPIWGHWKVTWSAEQVGHSLLESLTSTSLHCSWTVQTELSAELFMTTARRCQDISGYHWWPRDSLLLYNMYICSVQSKTQGCSDQTSPADKLNQWCNSLQGSKSLPFTASL